MNKTVLVIAIFAIVIAGGGLLYYLSTNTEDEKVSNSPESTSSSPETDLDHAESTTYSLDTVMEHNSAIDCWLVIDNKVYDVTPFVGSHPGGDAILAGCGQDATELFETRPMGSGTSHSSSAKIILENYYIGELE